MGSACGTSRNFIVLALAGAGERGTIWKREAEESLCPARGEWTTEIFRVSLARVGERKFPQVWRAVFEHWNSTNLPRAEPGYGQFREPGGAGATNEGKQKAFVPPPAGRAGRVPRKSFRGKSCFPLAGFASRGGSFHPAAERVARLWAPPAPSRRAERGTRAGASPVLQTPPRGTAPPGSRNCP